MSNSFNNNNDDKSMIPWWAIITAFVVGWPIGIVLLIIRIGQENGQFSSKKGKQSFDYFAGRAQHYAGEVKTEVQEAAETIRRDAQRFQQAHQQTMQQRQQQARQTQHAPQGQQQARQGWQQAPQGQQTGPAAGSSRRAVWEQRFRKLATGKTMTIAGAVIMALFGFATISTFVDNLGMSFLEMASELVPTFLLTGVGAGMFAWGRMKKSQNKRFRRYLSLIGDQTEVSIASLAAAYPAKIDACCTTLEKMIEAGIFGTDAYLDYGRGVLVLDGSGVHAEAPKRPAPETPAGEENSWLQQIRQVNASIRDPEMTRKINRVEEITERILEFQKEHPESAAELRKFLSYYLPTTLKILNSYAELERQGVDGENIRATKTRIESMMDMVVEGFERQLDKLFAGDMMDIAADITVMEQMMQGDGLVGNGEEIGGH